MRAVDLHPGVIVTELRMPRIDGYELCRRLKGENATRDIPLVVVTASAFAADVARAAEAGGDVVVCKPCLPADLVELLDVVLAQSRSLRAASQEVRARAVNALARSRVVLARSDRLKRPT